MIAVLAFGLLKQTVSSLLIGMIIATLGAAALFVGTIAGLYAFLERSSEAWGDDAAEAHKPH